MQGKPDQQDLQVSGLEYTKDWQWPMHMPSIQPGGNLQRKEYHQHTSCSVQLLTEAVHANHHRGITTLKLEHGALLYVMLLTCTMCILLVLIPAVPARSPRRDRRARTAW
jgi:hypothetical protein